MGVFLLTFFPGKCVCLEKGRVGRLRALRWGRGHPDGYWSRAPPQQKSVLGVGSCRGSKTPSSSSEVFGWWVGCPGLWGIPDQQAGECQSPEE